MVVEGYNTSCFIGTLCRLINNYKKLKLKNSKFIFDEIEKKTNHDYSVYISYMEIYNENAFDLLEKRHLE
jgi:hypothetical protein